MVARLWHTLHKQIHLRGLLSYSCTQTAWGKAVDYMKEAGSIFFITGETAVLYSFPPFEECQRPPAPQHGSSSYSHHVFLRTCLANHRPAHA